MPENRGDDWMSANQTVGFLGWMEEYAVLAAVNEFGHGTQNGDRVRLQDRLRRLYRHHRHARPRGRRRGLLRPRYINSTTTTGRPIESRN